MKDYAKAFYLSTAWKKTRLAYLKSKGGLCELCLQEGLIVPGEIVHHKTFITPENINDPNITLNWDNLQLVCREHHEKIHRKPRGRYYFDDDGRVIPIDSDSPP